MSLDLAELRKQILNSKTSRKRGIDNVDQNEGDMKEDGELDEVMEDLPLTSSEIQNEPVATNGGASYVEPYLPNKRPSLHNNEDSGGASVAEGSSQLLPEVLYQQSATAPVKPGPNKYGQSSGKARNSNAVLTPYNPYAHLNQGFNPYPPFTHGTQYVGPPIPYPFHPGFVAHPSMMVPPAHPAANILFQQPLLYPLPTMNHAQAASRFRPSPPETPVTKVDTVFELSISATCQYKDLTISELISKFSKGQLPSHGQFTACLKILQALGERGDDLKSLESHSISLDSLKLAGIIPAQISTQVQQANFVTSTPVAQIDKNFAANRVNALLLPNRNGATKSHDLTNSSSAIKKTLEQISRCTVDTVVPLLNFNGYVQTADAVVELSKLLEINGLPISPGSQKNASILNQNVIDKPCPLEENKQVCPNPGCFFRHRCNFDNALPGDLEGLLQQLFVLYPNDAFFLRLRLNEIVRKAEAKGASISETLRNIRWFFCNVQTANSDGLADETTTKEHDESDNNNEQTDSNGMEELESVNSPTGNSDTIETSLTRNVIVFKDLLEFLHTKQVNQPGMFSQHFTSTGNSVTTKVFQNFMQEVRETDSATETIEALNELLSEGKGSSILWTLYFSLVLFYQVTPSKSLLELSFQKYPHLPLLHNLVYLAYPSMTDKALVLQLMIKTAVENPQDPKHTSNVILHGLVNLLAVLDATRASPVAILGSYARLLVDSKAPTSLRRYLAGDFTDFPNELPLISAFITSKLKGEDFAFCWLVFIYYLAFHGLPPVFASAPFNSCLKPDLFLIQWHLAPEEIVKENLSALLLVFSELMRQRYILQNIGCNGLIALLRNYISFANTFAPLKLLDIEKILREILDEIPLLAEIHELLFTVLQMQSLTVPSNFWTSALAQVNSPGLANFYISLNMKDGKLPAALKLARAHRASGYSQCYFSWIVQSYDTLCLVARNAIREEIRVLFRNAFASSSNPQMLECLRLEFLRCVHLVGDCHAFYDVLNVLDDVLCASPTSFIPTQFSSIAKEGIVEAVDYTFAEKAMSLVVSLTTSPVALEDLLLEGSRRFPGSFDVIKWLCESEVGNLYQTASTFVANFPTDVPAWQHVLSHTLENPELSPSISEILSSNRAFFSTSPRLFSLSLFP